MLSGLFHPFLRPGAEAQAAPGRVMETVAAVLSLGESLHRDMLFTLGGGSPGAGAAQATAGHCPRWRHCQEGLGTEERDSWGQDGACGSGVRGWGVQPPGSLASG